MAPTPSLFDLRASFAVLVVILFALLSAPSALAQRHLPATQIFTTPGRIFIDAAVEMPGVYDGVRQPPRPAAGENVEFQIFAPQLAGRSVFEYSFEILPGADSRVPPLEVLAVTDWSGAGVPVRKRGSSYGMLRPLFELLPRTGHLCNVTLRATGPLDTDAPVELRLTATVVSSPARRVHRQEATDVLQWR